MSKDVMLCPKCCEPNTIYEIEERRSRALTFACTSCGVESLASEYHEQPWFLEDLEPAAIVEIKRNFDIASPEVATALAQFVVGRDVPLPSRYVAFGKLVDAAEGELAIALERELLDKP